MIVNPNKIKRMGKQPKQFVGMGTCPDFAIRRSKNARKKTIAFKRKNEPIIAQDTNGKRIFIIIDKENRGKGKVGKESKAMQKYKEFFFGDKPGSIQKIDINWPKMMKYLGKCPHVSYRAYGHTKKKGTPYRHKFEKEPEVFISPDNDMILIQGGSFWINDWIRG